jgi:hypothetical protein
MSPHERLGPDDSTRDSSVSVLPDRMRRAIKLSPAASTRESSTSRPWHANLLRNPDFTFHLKNGLRADLSVYATPVTDPAARPRHHPADTARGLVPQQADAHHLQPNVRAHEGRRRWAEGSRNLP